MTERDVTESHLDAIEAQLALAQAQLTSFRHHLKRLKAHAEAIPQIEEAPRPEHCHGVDETRCGLRSDDGRMGNFGGTWTCRGCRKTNAEVSGA